MKFGVVVFPGSNCDHDAYHVISKVIGQPVDFIRELIRWLETNRGAVAAGHTALENIVDNITAIAARTLYKRENLR